MQSRVVIGALAALLLAVAAGASVPSVPQGGSADANATVLWAEACDGVLSEVLNGTTEGRWVYADPAPVPAGTVLKTWYGNVVLPPEPGWVVFIDDEPGGNWAHPCRYVFVDDLGWISVQNALGPPENLDDWPRLGPCPGDLVPGAEAGNRSFRCIAADDRVVSWHQRTVDAAEVEGDHILITLDRDTHERHRDEHWRDDVPDHAVPAVAEESARALARGTVTSARLFILSPDSSRFPVQSPPRTPCWVVRSAVDGGMETTVIDAMDGRILGTDRSGPATTGSSSGAGPLTTAPASPTPPQTPGFAGTGAIAGLLGAAVRLRRAGRSGVNRARPKP